jgi:hypothetical protein
VAEHSTDLGHHILPNIRHLVEMDLHPNNMNSRNRFSLSKSWEPLIHSVKGRKNIHSKDKTVTSSSDDTLLPGTLEKLLISSFPSAGAIKQAVSSTIPFPSCVNNTVVQKRIIFLPQFLFSQTGFYLLPPPVGQNGPILPTHLYNLIISSSYSLFGLQVTAAYSYKR